MSRPSNDSNTHASHENEYHDAMVDMLELVWGEGFMAPGGPGSVAKMVAGLTIRGKQVVEEYDALVEPSMFDSMVASLGREQAEHFVENWRALVVVCEKGEMRQGYSRGRKP